MVIGKKLKSDHTTQYTGSVARFLSLAWASSILAPQNHFDFDHFDGQNNFAIFT